MKKKGALRHGCRSPGRPGPRADTPPGSGPAEVLPQPVAAPSIPVEPLPNVTARVPDVTVQPPVTFTVATASIQYLPHSESLPEFYVRPKPMACRHCRALFMADGGRAVLVSTTTPTLVYLRCKACCRTFRLPVK